MIFPRPKLGKMTGPPGRWTTTEDMVRQNVNVTVKINDEAIGKQ